MPVRKGSSSNQIDARELPGGICVSLIHKGPYEGLRESYKKGPGMILKGNPKNYLTEIQVLIEE